MPNTITRELAEKSYRRGAALVEEHRHAEAVAELQRAEDLFRQLDARGHPFNYTRENGISGLANSLSLLGFCLMRVGDLPAAIDALESSMVNKRFERTIPFRSFRKSVEENLLQCYELLLSEKGLEKIVPVTEGEPPIDLAYQFPFSLPKPVIPLARLYELAPGRHPQYRSFYERARRKDAALRRAGNRTDDTTLRKISVGIWSILAAIWLAYGIVVVRTLMIR